MTTLVVWLEPEYPPSNSEGEECEFYVEAYKKKDKNIYICLMNPCGITMGDMADEVGPAIEHGEGLLADGRISSEKYDLRWGGRGQMLECQVSSMFEEKIPVGEWDLVL